MKGASFLELRPIFEAEAGSSRPLRGGAYSSGLAQRLDRVLDDCGRGQFGFAASQRFAAATARESAAAPGNAASVVGTPGAGWVARCRSGRA